MTCGKCERLIKEAVLEDVPEVKDVIVNREQGYADIIIPLLPDIQNQPLAADTKNNILNSIHKLVNGKFKARFDSGKLFSFVNLFIGKLYIKIIMNDVIRLNSEFPNI